MSSGYVVWYAATVNPERPKILHVCGREVLLDLRTRILATHGYDVVPTKHEREAHEIFQREPFSLLLIDVEGDGQVPIAQELCESVKEAKPEQKVAFVCNYRVSLESDCPDEIIRSDFNPAALVAGVEKLMK